MMTSRVPTGDGGADTEDSMIGVVRVHSELSEQFPLSVTQ